LNIQQPSTVFHIRSSEALTAADKIVLFEFEAHEAHALLMGIAAYQRLTIAVVLLSLVLQSAASDGGWQVAAMQLKSRMSTNSVPP
jgi:hypothetical protein